MKEFKVIRFLDKFRGLYEKAGVDYDIFRIILQAKLTMDGRRKTTVFNNESNKKSSESNEFYKDILENISIKRAGYLKMSLREIMNVKEEDIILTLIKGAIKSGKTQISEEFIY